MLTLFDLVIRSMRKNVKHYYLYFFALIFSVLLYFVFVLLEKDSSVIEATTASFKLATGFRAASILLLVITGIFIFYANSIFLKRRSREIGLYQLVGLRKSTIARMLIVENVLLSIGAMLIGIGIGLFVSRIFLLLLMKLIGFEGYIDLIFSMDAVMRTFVVFFIIIGLTSIQMIVSVYRNSLLDLFKASQKSEQLKKPKAGVSAVFTFVGIGLIVFGYWLSGRMINTWLLFNMLAVLASTISGTYLLFRVAISYVLYKVRERKHGHLGLVNSLSLAPLMYRMKANASSLTLIAVLSAMTLAISAASYSFYYSAEKEARQEVPFDFVFKGNGSKKLEETMSGQFLKALEHNGIFYKKHNIELLYTDVFFDGKGLGSMGWMNTNQQIAFISDTNLREAGFELHDLQSKEAVFYDITVGSLLKSAKSSIHLSFPDHAPIDELRDIEIGDGQIVYSLGYGPQVVIDDTVYQQLRAQMRPRLEEVLVVNLRNEKHLPKATEIALQPEFNELPAGFYETYLTRFQNSGLLIFITGFLGLVFLISTGSILYFKQMTEAEQEKQGYATLRQLGFTVQEMMKGVVKKQLFVFGLPLLIGISHAIFAIKSASFLFTSDITIPVIIAMSTYALIYLLFAFLSIGYYRKVIKQALV